MLWHKSLLEKTAALDSFPSCSSSGLQAGCKVNIYSLAPLRVLQSPPGGTGLVINAAHQGWEQGKVKAQRDRRWEQGHGDAQVLQAQGMWGHLQLKPHLPSHSFTWNPSAHAPREPLDRKELRNELSSQSSGGIPRRTIPICWGCQTTQPLNPSGRHHPGKSAFPRTKDLKCSLLKSYWNFNQLCKSLDEWKGSGEMHLCLCESKNRMLSLILWCFHITSLSSYGI